MSTHQGSAVGLWQQAASFAAWKHRHQVRKDGRTPYVAHPFRVAMTVREVFGCDDAVALASALLHDTIEDTLTDYDEIHDRFGVEVADIVAALSKNMTLPEARRETDYDGRLAAADWRAQLVKLADVFDNHSDLPDRSPAALADVNDKCRRAIVIAERHAREHAPIAAGIAAVRALMQG